MFKTVLLRQFESVRTFFIDLNKLR